MTPSKPLAGNPPAARIRRFLAAHREHFSLALVLINRPESRHDFLTWLADECRQADWPLTTISASGLDPGPWLERLSLANGQSGVFVLTDLDDALGRPETGMATAINRQRERLAGWLRGPVLLVLGDLAFDRLLIDAPDLADWHAAVLRWEEAPSVAGPSLAKRDFTSESQLPRDLLERTIRLSREQHQAEGRPEARARLLVELADRLVSVGQSAEALDKAREAVALYRSLPGAGEQAMARALVTLADIMVSRGSSDEALALNREALDLREKLVVQEPGRADFLRDLSVSYVKIGDLMRGLGQGELARQFFQKSLDIAEKLVQQEPGRADFLRDLSVAYDRMGDLLLGLGQGDLARQFFQKALDLREKLALQEPGLADFLRDLSVSYIKMGDLMRGLGQGELARQLFQKSLDIAERLVVQEPARTDFLHLLSAIYSKMGDVLLSLGQGELARQFFQKFLDIAEKLVHQEPGRADFLHDLAISLERMGDLANTAKDGEAARGFFLRALEIRERLVGQQPGRADLEVAIVVPLVRLGDRASLTRALDILQRLEAEGRLTAQQAPWRATVEEMLQELDPHRRPE